MIPLRDVVASLVADGRELAQLDDQISAQLREIEQRLRDRGIIRVRAVKLPDGAELAWSGAVRGIRRRGIGAHRWRLVIRDVDGSVTDLFRRGLAYAEPRCERVCVLSGALGLIDLDTVTAPYDRRLCGKSERTAWGRRVAGILLDRHGRDTEYLVLAGADYADPLVTALRTYDGNRGDGWRGVPLERILQPLLGLPVGERLRWLNEPCLSGSHPSRPPVVPG